MPGLGRRQAVAATRVVRRPGSPRRGARPGRTRGRVVPSKIHPPDLPRDAAHGRRSSPDGGCRQTSERCGELRQSTDSAGEARGRSRGRATAVPPAVPARWPTDLHISGVAGGADGRWKVNVRPPHPAVPRSPPVLANPDRGTAVHPPGPIHPFARPWASRYFSARRLAGARSRYAEAGGNGGDVTPLSSAGPDMSAPAGPAWRVVQRPRLACGPAYVFRMAGTSAALSSVYE